MFCLEINTKIKGSKISGILFLNFHSWNCSRILENSFREFSFPGIKKSWKILSWKTIVLEFSQNNLYFPWNLQFWNFPFLEFSTPGILSWNFLFLESYFTEFSCYRERSWAGSKVAWKGCQRTAGPNLSINPWASLTYVNSPSEAPFWSWPMW